MKDSHGQLGAIVESVSNILGRWAAPQPDDHRVDKNGILTMYPTSEANANILKFVFVTPDDMKVELPFDLKLLAKDGKKYFNKAIGGVVEGIEQYRKKRKATGPLIITAKPSPILLNSQGATH